MTWPELHYAPFNAEDLLLRISEATTRWPGCIMTPSGVGDLSVYDSEGLYVGVIELGDPPELVVIPVTKEIDFNQ